MRNMMICLLTTLLAFSSYGKTEVPYTTFEKISALKLIQVYQPDAYQKEFSAEAKALEGEIFEKVEVGQTRLKFKYKGKAFTFEMVKDANHPVRINGQKLSLNQVANQAEMEKVFESLFPKSTAQILIQLLLPQAHAYTAPVRRGGPGIGGPTGIPGGNQPRYIGGPQPRPGFGGRPGFVGPSRSSYQYQFQRPSPFMGIMQLLMSFLGGGNNGGGLMGLLGGLFNFGGNSQPQHYNNQPQPLPQPAPVHVGEPSETTTPQAQAPAAAVGDVASAGVSCPASYSADACLIFNQTNEQRRAHNLPALKASGSCTTLAQEHANDMASRNFFDHKSPTNGDFRTRAQRFGVKLPASENISLRGARDAGGVVQDWMGSPAHRANILNPAYKEVGIGVQNGRYVQCFNG